MKRLFIILIAAAQLIFAAGCVAGGPGGFAKTPMDAAVLEVLDAPTQAFFNGFYTHPPVSMTVRYDQHFADATVTDPALMNSMYEAIIKMRITARTQMSSTDGYHSVSFAAADGSTYSIDFENSVLCEGGERYILDNAQEFWKLFKSTAEEYSRFSQEGASRSGQGVPLFDFYDDINIRAFADDFYTDMPDSANIILSREERYEITVTDPEALIELFEALEIMTVEGPTDERVSDSDTWIAFNYEGGRGYEFLFNGYNLEVYSLVGEGSNVYTVSGGEVFFSLISDNYSG